MNLTSRLLKMKQMWMTLSKEDRVELLGSASTAILGAIGLYVFLMLGHALGL